MLAGLDEEAFQRWYKFFSEEPFGPQVENLLAAQTAAMAAHNPDVDSFLPLTVPVE